MKLSGLFIVVLIALLLVIAGPSLFAQKQILTFESGSVSQWVVSAQAGTTNALVLTDNADDYTQGSGSMQVAAYIRGFAASWGTWTDSRNTFSAPVDLSGYDDIRFDMKIVTKPQHASTPISANRNIQFVVDVIDSVGAYGTGGATAMWRYAGGTGDMNIFYYPRTHFLPSLDGWFTVVIPIKSLRVPGWAQPTNFDNTFHGDHVVGIGFGVDGDSSAADSVTFLMDNMRATKKQSVVKVQSMDGPATAWTVGSQPGADITATITDFADDYVEGAGSASVFTSIRTQAAGWGSWTDYGYNFPQPLDATGATELRFWYRTITPTAAGKRLQFIVDLNDTHGGPWRWANGAGQFGLFASGLANNASPGSWTEVVIPLLDLSVPSWSTSDTYIHLDSLVSLHFGIDADSSGADSVQFLLDNFSLNKQLVTSVENLGTAGIPGQFCLKQNYPNPFNPTTNIQYTLNKSGITNLKVYNILGQHVMTVVNNEFQTANTYKTAIDMSRFTSGLYFCILQQGNNRSVQKMMLLK
jgi:hypothetical protein